MVRAENIVKYKTCDEIISEVSFWVKKKEIVQICTCTSQQSNILSYLLSGIERVDSGYLSINGIELGTLNDDERIILRRRYIGYITIENGFFNSMDIYNNILLPIKLDGNKVDEAYINKLVNLLGLSRYLYDYPNKVSLSIQRRVAIARAMAIKPILLIMTIDNDWTDLDNNELIMSVCYLAKQYQITLVALSKKCKIPFFDRQIVL